MKNILIPAVIFIITMTVTPGPNNMLLTVSGAKFGYRKSLPFIVGIIIGEVSQLVLSALGLGVLFLHYPLAQLLLKITGSLYLVYLAVKIAFSRKSGKSAEDKVDEPMSMLHGIFFQYLNPKAYVFALTVMSVYPLQGELFFQSALLIIISFILICPLSVSLWAGFGSLLKPLMMNGRYARSMNYVLGGVTALSVVFILM